MLGSWYIYFSVIWYQNVVILYAWLFYNDPFRLAFIHSAEKVVALFCELHYPLSFPRNHLQFHVKLVLFFHILIGDKLHCYWNFVYALLNIKDIYLYQTRVKHEGPTRLALTICLFRFFFRNVSVVISDFLHECKILSEVRTAKVGFRILCNFIQFLSDYQSNFMQKWVKNGF